MAVKKTTTTPHKNSFIKETEAVVENVKTETVETVEAKEVPVETSKKTVKKFNPDDLILCQSICVGQKILLTNKKRLNRFMIICILLKILKSFSH